MKFERYRVGFEKPGVASGVTNRNPDMIPVIDTNTAFVYGEVVCLAMTKEIAQIICDSLNVVNFLKGNQ